MSDAELLHTLTPAESHALEDTGEPRTSVTALEDARGIVVPPRALHGFLTGRPRAAISLPERLSPRVREAEARRPG